MNTVSKVNGKEYLHGDDNPDSFPPEVTASIAWYYDRARPSYCLARSSRWFSYPASRLFVDLLSHNSTPYQTGETLKSLPGLPYSVAPLRIWHDLVLEALTMRDGRIHHQTYRFLPMTVKGNRPTSFLKLDKLDMCLNQDLFRRWAPHMVLPRKKAEEKWSNSASKICSDMDWPEW